MSSELPDVSCWEPVTIATPCLGTKLPAQPQGHGNRVPVPVPAPAWGGRAGNPAAPPAGLSARPTSPPETSPCFPSFQRLGSWNLHPLGFAIFTHPEPSGLHGDTSKQQIPGSNDVTFPFPAAQAWRLCCPGLLLGPPSAPSQPQAMWTTAGLSSSLARHSGPSAGGVLLLPAPESHCAAAPS